MFFPVWCWFYLLLLRAYAFCLVTICALYLGAGQCGTRAWRHIPIAHEDPNGHRHSPLWGRRPRHKSTCYLHKVPSWEVLTFIWCGVLCKWKLCQEEVSIKCKSDLHFIVTSLHSLVPTYLTSLPTSLTSSLARALLVPFLCLECCSCLSSLVTNFLTILTI